MTARNSSPPWMTGIVAGQHRADDQAADAGNREHLLDDDRAAEQRAGDDAADGQNGDRARSGSP